MGQKPGYPPVNIPISTKIDQNGWCTCPKVVPLVLTHSHVNLRNPKGEPKKSQLIPLVRTDSSKHHIGATKRTLFAKRCILYAAKGLVPKWEDCPAPLGSSPQQLMGVELMPLPQRGRNPPTSPDALPASWVRKESSEDQFDQFAFD